MKQYQLFGHQQPMSINKQASLCKDHALNYSDYQQIIGSAKISNDVNKIVSEDKSNTLMYQGSTSAFQSKKGLF